MLCPMSTQRLWDGYSSTGGFKEMKSGPTTWQRGQDSFDRSRACPWFWMANSQSPNKANFKLAKTGHSHTRNHLVMVCLLRGDTGYRLSRQAPESTKHLLLKSYPLDIRRRLFGSKQSDEGVDASFREKIMEIVHEGRLILTWIWVHTLSLQK